MNESDPLGNVHYWSSGENKTWKNSGLIFTTAQVVHITARIIFIPS